jgi:ATP-dependent Lhr-like helicase
MEHFYISQQNQPDEKENADALPVLDEKTDTAPEHADAGMGYIFEHTRGKKCLVFVNSREECEAVTTTLRSYCEAKHEPDRFLIHHGNLSAAYRETAEEAMKDDDIFMTTCTTATLELGIDIGRLERAFQIDAPFTVSSFLQRMGRTGRRDLSPEMWFVIREELPEPRSMLPETIPWKLLQGIALVQVYLEEKWVEPPKLDRLPYSLLYHQTMSTLASCGELTPAELASKVLTLKYFHRITQDDYKILLRHLLENDHIQRTDEGGLIIGLAGERIVNSFKFYAVFQENEEYTVRWGSQELGTIVMPPPAGEKLAIAGHVWIVEEVDHKRRLVYCEQIKGKVPAYFGDCPGDINTKIILRMREVLREDRSYPYLMKNAAARLVQARQTARNSKVTDTPLICLGGNMWCLFPWLGTYAFFAMERFLKLKCADRLGLRGMDSSRPYYIQFTMKVSPEEFFEVLADEARKEFDPMELVYPGEVPVFEKYDEFLPEVLVKKGFAYGILGISEMKERILSWIT